MKNIFFLNFIHSISQSEMKVFIPKLLIFFQKQLGFIVFRRHSKNLAAGITLIFANYAFNSCNYSSYECLANIANMSKKRAEKLQLIGFHCLFSNQLIDVSKLPNKHISIEKLRFIVHQSIFSNPCFQLTHN